MRVAVDVTPLIAGRTGVARYAAELTAALASLGVDVRPYALGRATVTPPPGVRRVVIPLRVLHRLWRSGELPPIDWLAPAADVVHTLDLVAPPSRRPSVASVHDLDALEHPELHRPRAIQTQEAQLASLRRVRVILTNSETTKAALCRRGIDGGRVIVGGLGLTGRTASGPWRSSWRGRPPLAAGGSGHRRAGRRQPLDVAGHGSGDPAGLPTGARLSPPGAQTGSRWLCLPAPRPRYWRRGATTIDLRQTATRA